jgi:phosphoglycolate phosphatase
MIRFLRRFDPHSIQLLVFDLDGTLIDSRLDLIHSVNAMLRHFGRPELADDVIASYVGDGAPTLVQRALGIAEPKASMPGVATAPNLVEDELFKQALEYFLGYYRLHKLDHTTVYDGIPETLAALAASCGTDTPFGSPSQSSGSLRIGSCGADTPVRPSVQRLMAVLTNKPVRPSQDIVQALGLGNYFVRVYGGNSFATKKPDPLGVRTLLEETGVAPAEALMIGDSSIDVQTGRNAGLWTCGVTYGFAPHSLKEVAPDVLVDRPAELGELLG